MLEIYDSVVVVVIVFLCDCVLSYENLYRHLGCNLVELQIETKNLSNFEVC